MRFARTAFGILCLSALLSSCNTTDALTPQVDVGGGTYPARSSPVTDGDLQRMAQTQQPVYPSRDAPAGGQPLATGQVYEQPLAAPQAPAYPANRQQTSGAQPQALGAPPRSLDQQAASLGEPQQPQAPRRAQLAAPAATLPPPASTAPQTQLASVSPAPAATDQTLRFLPIIGAPLSAVTPLSRQLGAEARSRGITIRGSGDATAKHVLKGYFSCVGGGGTITVTYVWDVLDGNGARLNRIQGQESFPGNATDPWSAVPPSVMQTIATKTMDSYTRWSAGP
nr:hypothetical protein [uncultured Gellertiella sp.]